MRVVLLSHRYPPVYSGPGRAAEALAQVLQGSGVEPIVLTLTPDGGGVSAPETTTTVRFRCSLSRRPRPFRLSIARALYFDVRCSAWLVLHRKAVDIVQYMSMPTWSFWLPMQVARRLGLPLFARVTMLGGDDLPTIARSKGGRIRLRWCGEIAGILAMTPELGGVPEVDTPPRVLVLPKYIDSVRFCPPAPGERSDLRHRLGIGEGEIVAAFVGSVDHRKGADLAVEALGVLRARGVRVKLCLVGPLDEREDGSGSRFGDGIRRRIDELSIADSIIAPGLVDDVAPWLRAADMFVFPSRREGLPSALLEAMATALPTVVCRAPWLPDPLAEDRQFGRVVAQDPAELAEAIAGLAADPVRARTMGDAGRQYVLEHHGPQRSIAKLVDSYASALAGRGQTVARGADV